MNRVRRPTLHLICNAHLDPVWQWRWEEGAAEALSTFRTAAAILREREDLVFNHNEAVLYRWVERYDPALFREIRRLVRLGRWAIGGGWHLQPDLNLPGLESLVRQIAEGRRYFREKFGAAPKVAYNFDSFGHGAGLPQVLVRAGYKMYIHMRPQAAEMALPADLYRWRGVDGTEIPVYRIEFGLYHTERDNIERRLEEGTELALARGRDVAVFWGIGDHGGGATREDLERIDAFRRREKRVRVLHGTPDGFYEAIKGKIKAAPVVEGDLQHVFTGCYTSLSRLKRQAQKSLGLLVQTEALRAASWRAKGQAYPDAELGEAWRGHLFNDFHDILTGSCVEPAEQDALALYGKVEEEARRLRLGAAAALNRGGDRRLYIPVTVMNANPASAAGPIEFECMSDLRPLWTGEWVLKLFRLDGTAVECQEEQPEALLPFHDWRRRLCFVDDLPGVGVARYEVRAVEKGTGAPPSPEKRSALNTCGDSWSLKFDQTSGCLTSLRAKGGGEIMAGPAPRALVIEDDGDSWGTDRWEYRKVAGEFAPAGPERIIQDGPVRTITESVLEYGRSRIVMHSIVYPKWPVLELRFRVQWNEERRRLKLAIPTVLDAPSILAEVPGGAIARPADGQEHVHGRWLFLEGRAADGRPAAFGLVNSGQPGFDLADGEIRLSVLRSAAYCHEQGFSLGTSPAAGAPGFARGSASAAKDRPLTARKYADIGVHDVRLFLIAGEPGDVRRRLPGLADRMSAPPFALAHLPIGAGVDGRDEFLALEPANVRLTALKRSWDGRALVVRLHEAAGMPADCRLRVGPGKGREITLKFRPYEIKTVRIEKSGAWREVALIEED
jgi:alpha-mannosidase